MAKFETVTRTATEVGKSWTNVEINQFHYFNPNGAVAIYNAAFNKLIKAVDNVNVMGGALLAYSGDYHYDKLAANVHNKRLSNFKATYYAEKLVEQAAKIEAFLEEKGA